MSHKLTWKGTITNPVPISHCLENYHEGLICLSACVNGYVDRTIIANQEAEAEKRAKELAEIFGSDHFYIELQKHINVPPQEVANPKLIALAKRLGLPIIATNDNHYTNKGDAEAQEILLCIQTQTTMQQKDRKLSMIDSPDFYLKSAEEMAEAISRISPSTCEHSKNCGHVQYRNNTWQMDYAEI